MGILNCIITSIIIGMLSVSNCSGRLLSIVQVFRHGDRIPLLFYPTDPYKNPKYWNGLSPGSLTEKGKYQLYDLGKYYRARYDNFIAQNYSEADLQVFSSNSKRNFQSAEYYLKGLYPNSYQNASVLKAEAPIMSSLVVCPKFDVEYLKLEETNPEFIDINRNNAFLYKYLKKYSKLPVYGLGTAFLLWDTLRVESEANLTLPEWASYVYPEPLTSAAYNLSRYLCYNKHQQALGVGPFFNSLFNHFDRIIDGSDEAKTILYSGHDVNLACFLSSFGYFDHLENVHVPPTASSLTFELRLNEENKYAVNIYYKPGDEMIPLQIKDCDYDCDYNQFKRMFQDVIISNAQWYMHCAFL